MALMIERGDIEIVDGRKNLRFWMRDGLDRVACTISASALTDAEDRDDADDRTLADRFRRNHARIEQEAERKFCAGLVGQDGGVRLTRDDLH